MSTGATHVEGIYRRVTVRMYGDEKFMRLSPLPPSGQSLWLYLLTGPHTGPIPGVFVIGRASLAEALGWEMKAFDEAFAEVLGEGLAQFDAKTRIWFIPNAVKHNMPNNPNVVLSWRTQWSLLPECGMREVIKKHLKATLDGLSEAFGKAFEEASGTASPKPSAKPLAKDSPKQETGSSEQKEPLQSPKGEGRFPEFWSAWPNTDRKQSRKNCLAKWKRKRFDDQADAIVANVKAMCMTRKWSDGFEPAPLTYLNGELWLDGVTIEPRALNGSHSPMHANDIFAGAA